MFIAVGIGNTNTAIGLIDSRKLFVNRKPTGMLKTANDFKALLHAAFSQCGWNIEKPYGSIFSSVVPELVEPSIHALSEFTGTQPLTVDTHIRTGLDFSGYNGLLGSDRIAVCAAAWNKCVSPCVVIDMGTAMTFNVIGPNAFFLGGAILPGLRMGLEALNRNTAQLPLVSFTEPPLAVGRNTEECLLAGAYYGTAAMADGMIERITELQNYKSKIFLTGGGAAAILPLLKTEVDYEQDLLLEGLAALYRNNTKSEV